MVQYLELLQSQQICQTRTPGWEAPGPERHRPAPAFLPVCPPSELFHSANLKVLELTYQSQQSSLLPCSQGTPETSPSSPPRWSSLGQERWDSPCCGGTSTGYDTGQPLTPRWCQSLTRTLGLAGTPHSLTQGPGAPVTRGSSQRLEVNTVLILYL